MPDHPPSTPPDQGASYTPIAVGFFLLSVPLWISIALAESTAGRVTNAVAALVMVAFGALVLRRQS